jgi:hypothetical protein
MALARRDGPTSYMRLEQDFVKVRADGLSLRPGPERDRVCDHPRLAELLWITFRVDVTTGTVAARERQPEQCRTLMTPTLWRASTPARAAVRKSRCPTVTSFLRVPSVAEPRSVW